MNNTKAMAIVYPNAPHMLSRIWLFALCMWGCGHSAADAGFVDEQDLRAPVLHQASTDLPNVLLKNQNNEPLRFYDEAIKDKIVVIQFIFTRCTMVCPLLGYTFAQLQEKLGERAGKEVFLISISVDPVNDTPQRLKAWAEQFGAANGWLQLTGEKSSVDSVLKALQSFTADKVDHTSLILMGDEQKGEWKRLAGTASAETLLTELQQWL